LKLCVIDSGRIIKDKYYYKYSVVVPDYGSLIVCDSLKRYVGDILIKNPYYDREYYFGNIYLNNSVVVVNVKSYDKKMKRFISELEKSDESQLAMRLSHDKYETNHYVDKKGVIINYSILDEFKNNEYITKHIYENINNYTIDLLQNLYKHLTVEMKNSYYGKKICDQIQNNTKIEKAGIKSIFHFSDISGKNYDFNDFIQNKEYGIIIFWASWCSPCKKEIPHLKELYRKYSKSIAFASLSIDTDKNEWIKAVKSSNINWLSLAGFHKSTTFLNDYFNVKLVPSYIIVDNKGIVILNSTKAQIEKEYIQIDEIDNMLSGLILKK
jgi:thiol-disulfide isomerase/thioredoxin